MSDELAQWLAALNSGDPGRVSSAARDFADSTSDPRKDFRFTVCDKYWNPIGEIGDDLMEASGTDPRNNLGSATLKIKYESELIPAFAQCTETMVGVIVETQGMRWPFYVDTFDLDYENGAWTGTANLLSIWDILNYLVILPMWYLPIQFQPFSHAIFWGPICTVLEAMAAEQAMRIQAGINEFINNALSGNPDARAWFGTWLQSNGNFATMLKTPIYVVRTNPFLDGSPQVVKTVRMETVGAMYRDITRPYGVDIRVDLWLPGDPQPDHWTETYEFMRLTQPTYVITIKDRSSIEGPFGNVLDSSLRTAVDFGGSLLGNIISPLVQQVPGMDGVFESPKLGVNYTPPWAMVVAPNHGEKGALTSCKITYHTPKGWQHIIGGRSPRWLNSLINALLSWLVDAITILIGITGIPSNLLEGFLNNAFFAFQLMQLYDRRDSVGPYHPCIETFTATSSPPYNIEALFQFINIFWDSRGYISAVFTFRNGEPYVLGKDIIRGGLISLIFMGRTKIYTDYIENVMWRISPTERDVFVQVGDGRAEEAPLAKHQRSITAAFESVNVLTLSPQN